MTVRVDGLFHCRQHVSILSVFSCSVSIFGLKIHCDLSSFFLPGSHTVVVVLTRHIYLFLSFAKRIFIFTALPSLMTSDSLKPHLSDLDKLFDSEDEGTDDRLHPTSSQHAVTGSNSVTTHAAGVVPSGGKSMASAHVTGPHSKWHN